MKDKNRSPIVLLTDFGIRDAFAGIVKGVILSINPGARILDLSHGIRPQDILHGSFVLSSSARFFPGGTIFCVVVDPGVGSGRRPILVKTRDYSFIGPDNGVMFPAAQENDIRSITHLTREEYFLQPVSSTFHGRDIFAPVAAHLSLGRPKENFGPCLDSMIPFEIPSPKSRGDELILTIIHIDTFGNLTLNLSGERFKEFSQGGFVLEASGAGDKKISINESCNTYAEAREGIPFVLESSTGHMEIAVKNGNAARTLGLERLDTMLLRSNE
ncbi:SAM hydrolase/SAM-dependent halogenase family protein [Desulfospira joergensenii]|uniref:SAM hydrolase/SAM-dependent halogenase family protein n=1 Tax=Desulfospira joergensenii TaxID=53329 RepID=UPI0003B56678|nr:SAM-dependent chlorinase/fluorinase [Desulfospira joergensenii]